MEPSVVLGIVQSCSCLATAADGGVGLDPARKVVLFTVMPEIAFKLAFSLPRLHQPHHAGMRFTGNLSSPPHDQNLLLRLNSPSHTKDIMHKPLINTDVSTKQLLTRNLPGYQRSLLGISINASIQIYFIHILLSLLDIYFKFI